ncbi:hypothetical protein [Micromonospora chokoriensis]|uniref:DUF4352 domain-containing protein n=1 Tax=Micromonospora chokoriensis TaxID=356851 RepID=A0A1C4UK86_9ACTN|nr:hypothetical protein [Micromonospora chokoriensis]SCE72146.1 hypothetical protein GA0070612_0507 [Micromonospora chokoriensis]
MTHPQPSAGQQDSHQPDQEPPTQPSSITPPQPAGDPALPPTPLPQTPLPPSPWSAAGSASQPPFSGAAYPATGEGHPVAGGPGHPLATSPPMPAQGSKKTVVAVAVSAAVLTLLACAGGIVAVVMGTKRAATGVTEAGPTPGVSREVVQPPARVPASAPPAGDTRNMSPGDTLVIDGDEGTIEITVTKFSTATKPCKAYGLKPDEGMYVIADVQLTVTKGTASANPLFFNWVAADGSQANAVAGAFSGCGKPMPSADELTAGTRRTGSVVFDVHDASGVLEYQPMFETAGSWKP